MTGLSVRDLAVRLGRREVVRGVTLDLPAPELVGLVGPNGAGKTSLLRALAGLLATASGSVAFDGRDLLRLPERERARIVGYLPQEHAVSWPLRVYDLVMLGRFPHRSPVAAASERDRRAVVSALAAMDALRFADRPVTQLSGGERSRVLLARALAQEPRLMLADEPTHGLDPSHQIALMQRLRRLAQGGCLVLVTLHDLTLAGRWCDRLVMLSEGRIVADGPADAVLTDARLSDVYGIEAVRVADGGNMLVVPARLAREREADHG